MQTIYIPSNIVLAINMLQTAGYAAYMVGGCVRDSILGKQPQDYDISTSATPEQTLEVFANYTTYKLGIAHGTVGVSLSSESEMIEITTFRIDGSYSDYRHPDSVSFTADPTHDLARRDFTINAMAYNASRGLLDPFGGQADLNAGIIRCVGNAHDRFGEDALRIMRGLRFSATLGFSLESDTARAVRENAQMLAGISAERINAELSKLILGDNAAAVLKEYSEVFAIVLPELAPMMGFSQYNPYHNRDVYTHSVDAMQSAPPKLNIRLALLLHDSGKPQSCSLDAKGIGHFYGHAKISAQLAQGALKRLRYDNKTIDAVTELVARHGLELSADKKIIRRWLLRLGKERFSELLDVILADNAAKTELADSSETEVHEIRRVLEEVLAQEGMPSLKNLAINGHDLLAIGLQGEKIGQLLSLCLDAVISQECENTRESLLALVKLNI